MAIRSVAYIAILVIALLTACADSSDSDRLPAAAAQPTIAPTTTLVPIPTEEPTAIAVVLFEQSLSSDDLVKFASLPTEFRDALLGEAQATSRDHALAYLHGLPDNAVPIADLLSTDAMQRFDKLPEKYQRQLLLEGYPNSGAVAYRDTMTDEEARFAMFETLVITTFGLWFGEGIEPLPALEEALSVSALAKLASLDPVMQDSFRLIWENTSAGRYNVTTTAMKLDEKLLAAPIEFPAIDELGLSEASVRVLGELPELEDIVVQFVAGRLVYRGVWNTKDAENLDDTLEQFDSPEGKAAFARNVLPSSPDSPFQIACMYSPLLGVKVPDWMVAAPFRDVPSYQLFFHWPPLEDVFSDAALANVRALDPEMREYFDSYYYGAGNLPKEAREMVCGVARWERILTDLTMTSAPDPEKLLSPEVFALYEQFSEHGKVSTMRTAMFNILRGEVRLQEKWATSTEVVSSFSATPAEFFEALHIWADQWVTEWACNAEGLGCGGS